MLKIKHTTEYNKKKLTDIVNNLVITSGERRGARLGVGN